MQHVLFFSGKSKSNLGWTPLHLACYFGHKDVVEELLKVRFLFLTKVPTLTSVITLAHRYKTQQHFRKHKDISDYGKGTTLLAPDWTELGQSKLVQGSKPLSEVTGLNQSCSCYTFSPRTAIMGL